MRLAASIVVFVGLFIFCKGARADVPPAGYAGCSDGNAPAGSSCMNDDGQPGTCQASMCSKSTETSVPNGDGGFVDGPITIAHYACTLCVASVDFCQGTYQAVCTNKDAGESCVLPDAGAGAAPAVCSFSQNCAHDAQRFLSCVAVPSSSEQAAGGGCNLAASDVESAVATLALLAPFAALRRKKKKAPRS